MTESKLGDRLEDKVSIKFTDYAIKNFQYDFKPESKSKCGSVKFSNSGLKGVKLFQYRKTKKKYFMQQFWFNNKPDYWTVGEFRSDVYGVNECRRDVNEIMDDHTNSEGLWIRNPKITRKHKNERVKKAEVLNRQMKTVRECIVELCKSNFPKIRKEGTVTGNTIRRFCLPLIGYNKRTQHLVYDDDEFGNGFVTFRANRKFHTNKPESWDDLFAKFPPGHGCINKINGRKVKDKSLYDSVESKMLIEELTFDNSLSIIKNLLKSYPHIVLLDPRTSHLYIINDLRINAVFTMSGSVAHEYPYFNIPVINASLNNPHINNKFCINPKSISELKKIIFNIPKLKFKVNMTELIDFYYMHKIYFNKSWLGVDLRKFITENNGLEKVNHDKQIDIKLLNYIKNHDKVIDKVKTFLDSDSYYLN